MAALLKRIVCWSGLLGIAVAVTARAAPQSSSAPRLDVDRDQVDFGTVYRGERIHHLFTLRNRGTADLLIKEIHNSCACSAASLSIDGRRIEEPELTGAKRLGVLSPGEEAQLEVTLRTGTFSVAGKDADVNKTIRIDSDDPDRPVLTLRIHASVVSPFTVAPDSLDFGVVTRGAGAKLSVLLRSDQLGDFPITGASAAMPELVDATVTRVETAPDEPPTWRLDAEIRRTAPLGEYETNVDLAVAHERVKEIAIQLHVSIAPAVEFIDNKPDRTDLLDFEVVTTGTPKTIELLIENHDPAVAYLLRDAAIGSCKPSSEGFTIESEELEKGVRYRVRLTAPATLGKSSYFQGEVVLTADHPDVPLRKIRFRGWYQAKKQ